MLLLQADRAQAEPTALNPLVQTQAGLLLLAPPPRQRQGQCMEATPCCLCRLGRRPQDCRVDSPPAIRQRRCQYMQRIAMPGSLEAASSSSA